VSGGDTAGEEQGRGSTSSEYSHVPTRSLPSSTISQQGLPSHLKLGQLSPFAATLLLALQGVFAGYLDAEYHSLGVHNPPILALFHTLSARCILIAKHCAHRVDYNTMTGRLLSTQTIVPLPSAVASIAVCRCNGSSWECSWALLCLCGRYVQVVQPCTPGHVKPSEER
jgi:hypothetical protein